MRAASRARAAVTAFSMMRRPMEGFSSSSGPSLAATADSTRPFTSGLPSRVLVWPSNCGSASFTLTTAERPSRVSSPVRFGSSSLSSLARRAYSLSARVRAERKPVRWLPPSIVWMQFANE